MGINQGTTYLKNSANKLIQGFKSKTKEGFDGILGDNNDMANVVRSDKANTQTQMYNFNNNIAQYGADYQSLKERTNLYLNDSKNNYNLKKNYNIFVNKSVNQDKIKETNQLGCATAISTQASIKNITYDPEFVKAYPKNFTNYADANTACKLWAADTASTVYAVNQNANGKDYHCYTGKGLLPNLKQYTKPNNLYTLSTGDKTTIKGGLFANSQIGGFSNTIIEQKWNINAMTKPTLIKKYNQKDYSDGTSPLAGTIDWWGTPPVIGNNFANNTSDTWGKDLFRWDRSAWWMTSSNYTFVGTLGYFYYLFENPSEYKWNTFNGGYWQPKYQFVAFYIVCDDQCELKVNGQVAMKWVNSRDLHDWGMGGLYLATNFTSGKNIIEVQLINTGGPAAFVLYAFADWNNGPLFTSGRQGWGYTNMPVNDYNKLTISQFDSTNPYGIYTTNTVPTGYEQCHPVMGGNINMNTIQSTYGKNCSGKPIPAAASCYGWNCQVEGQKCLKGSPGAGHLDWRCKKGDFGSRKWMMEMPANVNYGLQTPENNACIRATGAKGQYGEAKVTYDCNGEGTQWDFRATAKKDIYMIHSADKDVCLFGNGDGRRGVAPCVEAYNDQLWEVVQDDKHGYEDNWNFQLKSVNSGQLAIHNGIDTFMTWDKNGAGRAAWRAVLK